MNKECPVCNSPINAIFNAIILFKYDVSYFKCNVCGLIQTEEPYWLADAYSDAITDLDVGLVARNMNLAHKVKHVIEEYFDSDSIFLDHAGGYGLFVRMMRDAGFNFYRQDKYCQNIFAKYFDLENCNIKCGFELITAFEFLEHVVDPVQEIRSLLALSDTVLFSTELQPVSISSIDDWWYFVPETGQHITFFTQVTLSHIANFLGTNYFTDGKSLHLFTKKEFRNIDLDVNNYSKFSFLNRVKSMTCKFAGIKSARNTKSLIWSDFQMIRKSVNRSRKW